MNTSRRKILAGACVCALSAPLTVLSAHAADTPASSSKMDVFTALSTRRSVREYTPDNVTDEDLRLILKAGMDAPSAANEQPWEFIVIRDKLTQDMIGEANRFANYAKNSPVSVLLCLNEKKEKVKGMGILDMGMCAENMMLAAHGLGIGSVFTGIYPMPDRIKSFQTLCNLPSYVIPIGLIIFGYPQSRELREADRFNEKAIHKEKWNSSEKTS